MLMLAVMGGFDGSAETAAMIIGIPLIATAIGAALLMQPMKTARTSSEAGRYLDKGSFQLAGCLMLCGGDEGGNLDGESLTGDELMSMKEMGFSFIIRLAEDGTGTYDAFGGVEDIRTTIEVFDADAYDALASYPATIA